MIHDYALLNNLGVFCQTLFYIVWSPNFETLAKTPLNALLVHSIKMR